MTGVSQNPAAPKTACIAATDEFAVASTHCGNSAETAVWLQLGGQVLAATFAGTFPRGAFFRQQQDAFVRQQPVLQAACEAKTARINGPFDTTSTSASSKPLSVL